MMLPPQACARISRDPLSEAFAARRPTHWTGGARPVEDPAATWESLLDQSRIGKALAYLHVPFCANHCLYCGFYRHPLEAGFSGRYVQSVIAELARDAERDAVRSGPIHAVYFGGGTPTALEARDLFALIRAVRASLPLAPDCEITVEGRVFGFDEERMAACVEAGANRFSIGIQTFDTRLRRRIGRKADREEAEAFMSRLRGLDQAAVVCDLIYGLPGQTLPMWREDVETVVRLGLDGVDLYALNLFPDSPMAKSIAKGALPPASSLPEQGRMYAEGLEVLESAGWRHLTQAHWASNTRERSIYNQLAKQQTTCLAYGAGAGGMLAGHRYFLTPDESAYRARVAAGEKPIAAMMGPARGAPVWAAVSDMLETGRIIPSRLSGLGRADLGESLEPLLDNWVGAGLIRPEFRTHALTPAGWFWQPNLIGALCDIITGATPPHAGPGMHGHPGGAHPSSSHSHEVASHG